MIKKIGILSVLLVLLGAGCSKTVAPAATVLPTSGGEKIVATSTTVAVTTTVELSPEKQAAAAAFDAAMVKTAAIDADFDGLSNDEEKKLDIDPNNADTDGDGLLDGDEVNVYHTNPLKADTDSDGFSDGEEVKRGFNPLGPGKLHS